MYGILAYDNMYLQLMKINKMLFIGMVVCGAFFIATASVGVVAAATKNHFLAFLVTLAILLTSPQFGFMAKCIMLIFIALGIATVIMKSKNSVASPV